MIKNMYKDRAVETAYLHLGVTIAHQSTQSVNCKRHEVEMTTTPIGIHVFHKKSGEEYMLTYDNTLYFKYLKQESPEQ